MKQRLLSLILAFCMVATLLPVQVFATPEGEDVPNLEQQFEEDGGITTPDEENEDTSTDETEGEPTDETEGEPTDETEGEPTDEAEGEPTDETEGEPTDETEGEPTDETEGEPTDEVEGEGEILLPFDVVPMEATTIEVTTTADSGEGSFRQALATVPDGGTITFNLSSDDKTITLLTPLPQITKSMTIEGGGITLTREYASDDEITGTSQLLYINKSGITVNIRRVHFKDGRATDNGGAITNDYATLNLESCIFSGNQTTDYAWGGAVYNANSGKLNVRGCTFYNNKAYRGGAIYHSSGTTTLTGNVFYGNTASSSSDGDVVYKHNGTVSSGGYNVYDSTSYGFEFNTTGEASDKEVTTIPISPITFKVRLGSLVANLLPDSLPVGYPEFDFYGNEIRVGGAAGAVQEVVTGWLLNESSWGPGTVSLTKGDLDANGMFDVGEEITLTATPIGTNTILLHWLVNGRKTASTSENALTLTMDEDKIVVAVFAYVVNTTDDNDTDDNHLTLREAITAANELSDATIIFAEGVKGNTITLTTSLPTITKSMTIEGDGITLTREYLSSSDITDTSQLLYVYGTSTTVTIRRIHFKGGNATKWGGAIRNSYSTLNVESCIFTGNKTTTDVSYSGGAIYNANDGTLNVRGCTFYNNSAYQGGAIFHSSGTTTLTGNVFYGNTATDSGNVVYKTDSGTVKSGGYNVYDNTSKGFSFSVKSDKKVTTIPFSLISYKVRPGSEAKNLLPASPPEGYPTVDFYGNPIVAGGAAGAVQGVTAEGYVLDYSSKGPGTVEVTYGNEQDPDLDGILSENSTVTLTATATGNNTTFLYWLVNGKKPEDGATENSLTLTMNEDKIVVAVFAFVVNTDADNAIDDDDYLTLREAITAANETGDAITFAEGVEEITLATPLPEITRSMTIEGDGITLTQSNFTVDNTSQLLYINGSNASVTIRRVHFKNGCATTYGGAIRNGAATLNLESCIFSGNQTTASNAYGGAVYNGNSGKLNVRGCTFYNNKSAYRGGAIYHYSGTTTLTGNVFYGNTASNSGNVVYKSSNGTVTSGGYNVYDSTSPNFTFSGTGDKEVTTIPFSTVSFRLRHNSGAKNLLPDPLPEGYPTVDFYGNPIVAGDAAGAVRGVTAEGYVLDYSSIGPGTVSAEGTVDDDGIVQGGKVTLTATATGNNMTFLYWLVNGKKPEAGATENSLTLTMDEDKIVVAVFAYVVNTTDDNETDDAFMTLREAITAANKTDGAGITFANGVEEITLATPLPEITRSMTIEGNGITLTRNYLSSDDITDSSQLLFVNGSGITVTIRRVHFKDGRATEYGGAIRNNYATLNLEACIFSGNKTTIGGIASIHGGAVYSNGITLNVRGCTFYNNSAQHGGAIYHDSGTATLTGNVFYGNKASSSGNVVYKSSGTVTSGGYNVYDVADPGFTGTTGDTQGEATIPFLPTSFKLRYYSAAKNLLPDPLPDGYPTVDFYGTPIQIGGAAGAVQGATANGYVLDYSSAGPGTVLVTNGTVDGDGIVEGGEVTLTVTPHSDMTLQYWLVNGVKTEGTPENPLTITLDINEDTVAVAVFSLVVNTTADNATAGDEHFTLREAIMAANKINGAVITFGEGVKGEIITLAAPLPSITKSMTIEGDGITLTQSGFAVSNTSQLLRTNKSGITVTIRRVHFKNGCATTYGGAIRNDYATLNLEACIFSGNQTTASNAYGGAVYNGNSGKLNVRGCTFYNNKSAYRGGAIYHYSGTTTLTGNVFYGNTATDSSNVVHKYNGTAKSGGYNVYDSTCSHLSQSSDKRDGSNTPPFLTDTFRAIRASAADGRLPAELPAGYPTVDFCGNEIVAGGAAGAAQVEKVAVTDDMIQTIATQTYTGSQITPTITVRDSIGTLVLNTDYTVSYGENINVPAGGTVQITGIGKYYNGTAEATFTIKKANPTVTAPTKVDNLVYTGEAQELVEAGSTNDGEIHYSLAQNSGYSADIPTATNAGTHSVWYKVVGDANHLDTKAVEITVSIAKADATLTPPTAITGLTYTGSAQALIEPGSTTGGELQYSLSENSGFSTSIPTRTDAGTYSVWYKVVGDSNHNNIAAAKVDVDVTIAKADATLTPPTAITGLTYTGSAQELVVMGSTTGGTLQYSLSEDSGFSTSIPTKTNAGTYSVWYKVVGGSNYNDIAAAKVDVDVTIAKAAGSFGTPAAVNATYSPTLTLANVTPPANYVWQDDTTEITSAGDSQTFAATYTDPSGNYESATGEITVNVAKAVGTFVATTALNTTYTPTLTLADVTPPTNYAWQSSATAITAAGSGQTFAATYTDPSGNYESATGEITVNVAKANQAAITLSGVEDFYHTAPPFSPAVTGGTTAGAVTYSYSGRDGTTYVASPDMPTEIGKYTITATMAGNGNYYDVSTSQDFAILINTGTDVLTVLGQTPEWEIKEEETVKTAKIQVSYSASKLTADDFVLSRMARVLFAETETPTEAEELPLKVGENVIYLMVTAENGTQEEYTLTVVRAPEPSSPVKPIIIDKPENGGIKLDKTNPKRGETVTITPAPSEGYQVGEVIVTDKKGNEISVTPNADGTYSFDYPGSQVTVHVDFVVVDAPWENPFGDVAEDVWYYEAVKYANENGLMKGITGGDEEVSFAPNMNLNRGMMVQILWSLDQRDAGPNAAHVAGGEFRFNDVETGAWYASAVSWAAEQGIAKGYNNGSFGPNDNITREQMAVMLYQYCRYKGIELPTMRGWDEVTDSAAVSGWALEAVQAMYQAGILNGKGENLFDPKSTATRAEVAQMLMNLLEAIQ